MKIYAGNLSTTVTESDLREAFSAHGTVDSCRLATDKFSGAVKGFGFVEMANATEAQAAITALNGSSLGGQTIKVNESRPNPAAGS